MLKNAFGIFGLWELGFRLTRLGSQEISATDFGEIRHRLLGNASPILGNASPILGKSVTDFEEIHHRFRGNPLPILGKCVTDFGEKHAPFLGKTGSVFGTNKFGLGKNWFGLGEIGSVFGLAWDKSSSLTALNAKHVWVWIFEVLGLGVTKNTSAGGKLEG